MSPAEVIEPKPKPWADLIAGVVNLVLFTAVRGATLMVFWDWFIAGPKAPFQDLPSLSFLAALGISVMITLIIGPQFAPAKKMTPRNVFQSVLSFYFLVWACALVVHVLM